MTHQPFKSLHLTICVSLALVFAFAEITSAADREFVGILALAVEEDVAEELKLSSSVQQELLDLVDRREGDAIELAMSMRALPSADREARLAPFRKASEQEGLKLLTAEQIRALQAIQLRRAGMVALAKPAIAKQLKLTPQQREEIAKLLEQRREDAKSLSRRAAARFQAGIDQQLKGVLSPQQNMLWTQLTNSATDGNVADKTNNSGQKSQPNSAAPGQDAVQASANGKSVSPGGNPSSTLQFSFRFAPWRDVIEWFASEADLSLLMDTPPQGTFNYSDPREYTPAQAIDLLNSVLLTKGFTLVRREQMLMVVNLEDGVPPNLITETSLEKLDELGEYELARCLFTLRGIDAESAAEEIGRLIGPQGTVNVLSSANQLQITETAGRLRTFRKILEAGERNSDAALGEAKLIRLEHVRSNDVISSWRKLLGLTDEQNISGDGSLRVVKGKTSRQLLVTGQPHRVAEFMELVGILDVPSGSGSILDTPQLEVYSVTEADPASVLSVMQELFADAEEVRLASDPATGNLVALATPEEHATIRATIEQMQRDRRQLGVIRLRTVDPQLAMLSIEKLFGPPEGAAEQEGKVNTAPRVDADPISRSLLIRGSEAQIQDIRSLLVKMGEQPESASGGGGLSSGRGNLRMIPIDAATARRAIEQMNSIWPTLRKNRIRTVTPSSNIRGSRPGTQIRSDAIRSSDDEVSDDFDDQEDPNSASTTIRTTRSASPERRLAEGRSRYVVQLGTDGGSNIAGQSAEASQGQSANLDNQSVNNQSVSSTEIATELPDVIVTMGDQGLLIASEDTEALDAFEELFMTLADQLFTGTRELSIFYLKHAKAQVASEIVKQFIGGGSGSGGSSGGTMLGGLASAALGNMGGGIVGSLLGGGGGASASLSSGTTVLADPRLNALVVQATPKELDFIEELLTVIDRSNSPERIETIPRPRAIPVVNTDVNDVADVVRAVYASRMSGGGSVQNQPSPEEFIRAMSGQKNTGKSISDAVREQVQINISVDQRRNALLVVAPDDTFEEIRELVSELDFATPELADTIRYGSTNGTSPEIIRQAIEKLVSESTVSERSQTKKPAETPSPTPAARPGRSMEEMKRGMEFMKALQQRAAKENAAAAARKKAAFGKGKGGK